MQAFGLTWNRMLESGGITVDDEVNINITFEATVKQKLKNLRPL